MTDTESAMQALNDAVATKVNSAVSHTIINGAIVERSITTAKDPTALGPWLSTHYLGSIPYSEIIAIIGATWVMIQILKTIIPLIINLVRNIMPKKPVKPSITTTSTDKVKKAKPPKAAA